jgi:hypothetical protein
VSSTWRCRRRKLSRLTGPCSSEPRQTHAVPKCDGAPCRFLRVDVDSQRSLCRILSSTAPRLTPPSAAAPRGGRSTEYPSIPLGHPRRPRCAAHPGYPTFAKLGSRPKQILFSDCALDSCISVPPLLLHLSNPSLLSFLAPIVLTFVSLSCQLAVLTAPFISLAATPGREHRVPDGHFSFRRRTQRTTHAALTSRRLDDINERGTTR